MIQLLLLVCVVCCGSVVIPLGDEFIVNTNTTGIQNAPSVAVLENGNFVAIWDDDDRSGYGKSVCGQVFGALGNKVGAQFTVRSAYGDGIRSLSSSNVVGTSSGFVVVWRVSNPAAIYGQCLGQAGNKIDAEFIVTNSTNVQSPRVVADESRFVVSWSTSSGVAARRFDASICQPAGAEFTVMATSTSGRRAVVTSIGNGRFLAVATANVGPISRELRLSRFTSTGIIEREWGVDTEGTELLKDRLAEQTPYIASLPGGRFVICWIATYERTEMYCTIFDTTNSSSGKSFAIGETMFDHESESILVLDDSFIVLFSARRFNAAHAGIFVYGQRFTFGGASMSEVFRVDVAEGTRKTNSHAVIVGENKFVVVWHNVSNSGTSRDNVLARRFEVMNASPATTVRPSQQSSLVPMSPTSTLPSTPLPAVIVPPLPQETTTTVNNVGAAENTDDDGALEMSPVQREETQRDVDSAPHQYIFIAIGGAVLGFLFFIAGGSLFFMYTLQQRKQRERNEEVTQMLNDTMRMLESGSGTLSPSSRYSSVGNLAQTQLHYAVPPQENQSLRASLTGYMGLPCDDPTGAIHQ